MDSTKDTYPSASHGIDDPEAQVYFNLRSAHPLVPALTIWRYIKQGETDRSFEEFLCRITTGHKWTYTGTAYGGDDERWHGEGRCYCSNCGADGDA